MSGENKSKHKGQSGKCYNKIIYKVLGYKMRTSSSIQTNWRKLYGLAAVGGGSEK